MSEADPSTRVENYTENKKKYSIVIKITGGAIFAALSLAVAVVAKPLVDSLRTPWGMAWWDPVSVIWILSFFVFGYEAGTITSVIGMILLFVTDPTAGWFGPVFKFIATFPLIIVPLIVNKIRKKPLNSETALKPINLAINWGFSVIIRDIIMVGCNIFAIYVFFGGPSFFDAVPWGFLGLEEINIWLAFIVYVICLNTLQSISDYLIPYALTKPLQVTIPNLIIW
jgi:hypothetical protein